jgi:hypothetical protein
MEGNFLKEIRIWLRMRVNKGRGRLSVLMYLNNILRMGSRLRWWWDGTLNWSGFFKDIFRFLSSVMSLAYARLS